MLFCSIQFCLKSELILPRVKRDFSKNSDVWLFSGKIDFTSKPRFDLKVNYTSNFLTKSISQKQVHSKSFLANTSPNTSFSRIIFYSYYLFFFSLFGVLRAD